MLRTPFSKLSQHLSTLKSSNRAKLGRRLNIRTARDNCRHFVEQLLVNRGADFFPVGN